MQPRAWTFTILEGRVPPGRTREAIPGANSLQFSGIPFDQRAAGQNQGGDPWAYSCANGLRRPLPKGPASDLVWTPVPFYAGVTQPMAGLCVASPDGPQAGRSGTVPRPRWARHAWLCAPIQYAQRGLGFLYWAGAWIEMKSNFNASWLWSALKILQNLDKCPFGSTVLSWGRIRPR